MKNINVSFLALAGALLSGVVSAYEVEFNQTTWCTKTNGVVSGTYNYANKIPEGCTYTNSNSNLKIDGTATPGEKIYALKYILSVQPNSVGDLMMGTDFCIPRSEIVCDNIIGSLMLYVYPTYKAVDTFQLIATTNDWKNILPIGNPIPIRDDSYAESGWMSLPVDDVLPGISAIAKSQDDFALRIGVRAKAGGFSTTQGYLHRISVDFKARATPGKPFLVDCQTNELNEVIDPGKEYGRMAVKVNVSPEDKICNLVVTGILSRCNGERTVAVTNELEKIDGIYYEKMDDVTNRVPFDAGEVVTCSVFTKYQTTDPAISPLSEEGEFSEVVQYDVGKRGSVWINEIGIVNGKCFVELCGTTNRSYLSGWQVILSGNDKAYTNNLSTVFDFATNMVNGVVGIETYRWTDLDSGECKNAMLELRNSAGVVEFAATDVSIPSHYQMTGKAKWHGKTNDDWSYDWTGTATDGTFTFGLSDELATFGHVNGGQGFLVPVGTKLYFTTLIEGNDDPLPYASISATVDGILNGKEGTTNFVGQTDEAAGTAEIGICGYSDDASYVLMTNSISAFAWKSDNIVTNVSLYSNIYLTNNVKPDVAYDDFSELKDYWRNESAITVGTKTYYLGIANGLLQLESFNGQAGKDATLTSKSYMALRGKRHLDISLDVWNTKVGVPASRIMITVDFSDTPDFKGNVFETVGLANKNQEYKEGEQYTFRECVELPLGFAQEGKVWIRVRALKEGASSSGVAKIDNLCIAAQDSVKINEFKMDEPRGSGFPLEVPSSVELDISPLTGGIVSNFVDEVLTSVETNYVRKVAADLIFTINENVFAVPFSFADGSLTNDVSAAEKNVKMTIAPSTITKMTGGFLPGDEVQYYVRVTYDPDDADDSVNRDERYYPDNATVTANGWRVENGYLPVANSFTVTGPALSVYGTPEITADRITVNYNAWDADGIASLGFEVTSNGVPVQTESLTTNGVGRVMGIFSATNLAANTEYVLSMSGTRTGGGDLTPTNYTFVTLPLLTSAKIDGISATEAKLTVSGQAAGYVVTPDEWKAEQGSATTWTRVGPSPNFEFEATVYATNKVGAASVVTNTVSGYTLADVATKAPQIEKVVNEVKVSAPTGYDAGDDRNPDDTEYTIRVVTSAGKTNDVNKWQTLADWANPVMVGHPDIDLEATNNFWFITRNHDGIVTGNDNKDTTTNCWFELVADITNVVQKAEPFGTVDIALKFFDPARKTATATVKYSFDEKSWTDVCAPFEVQFVDFTAGANLSWDARAAVENSFATEEWNKKHPYSLKVQLTAGPRTSEWMVKDGCEVDFTKPKVTEFKSDVPDDFNKSPMKVTVKFSKPVVDFTAEKVLVNDNGTKGKLVAGQDNTYTIDVTPNAQGEVTVQIASVKDKFGNESAATSVLKWTYDTQAPVWDAEPITGTPANGSATNGTGYALMAHVTDNYTTAEAIKYYWSFDKQDWSSDSGAEFKGDVEDGEKEYTVYVYAKDAAGNVSTTNTWCWTYDKTAPDWDTPAVKGTPANGSYTNEAHYALTARATDNLPTEVPIYYWSFDKQTWTAGQTFEGDVTQGEKEYTLYVYATDRAGNVAPTNEWSWTYDKTAPSVPVINGMPTDKAVTTETSYRFTAKSEDNIKTDLTYSWQLYKGAEVKKSEDKPENEPFGGNDLEDGIYTVTVNAKDKAGNTSVSTNWTWTVDNTPPEKPVISGTPAQGVHTNVNDFAFTANSETVTKDLTKLTYHWLTNGVWAADITNFIGYVTMEGEHTVSVYATDKAGNTSETNSLSWVYDRTPPDKPNFTAECNPKDNDITNDPSYFFKASSSDKLSDFVCYWKKSWKATEKSGNSIEGNLGNEANDHFWVEVWAKDIAGNVSATNRLSWTLDQIPPELGKIDPATPTNGAFTAETTFNFKGNATDNLTTITYHWLTNGVWAADVTNLTDEVVGMVAAEGQHTYSVYATDAAGNFSKATNSVTWTVDWSAPTNLVVTGEPANGAVTNLTSFALKAMAMDLTKPTICWTLDEGQMVKTPTNVEFNSSGTLSQGLHTVECYAVDQAGNQSEPTNWTWTVDTEAPVVAIKPDGVGDVTFVYPIPMKMTVRDAHEVVTALTAGDFVITATNEVEDVITDVEIVEGSFNNDGNTNYTFKVTSPEKALYGPVWISVKMNKAVADEAGNKSALAEGGVISDRTQPGVTIWTDAPSTNNAAVVDYKLSIASFSPITNNLAAGNITVPSGCNVTDFKGIGETIAGGIYTNYSFQVETRALVDTLMTVSLPAGSVFNRAGNSNDVATANMVMSDHTPPVPVLACVAASLTNNLPAIPFEITVVETNGLRTSLNGNSIKVSGDAEIKNFSGSRLKYSFNVVPKNDDVGEIKVKVNAAAITDFAGNASVESEVVSVVSDRTEPTATMATATDLSIPRKEDVLAFTVTLADSQNHLSAESNYLTPASFEPDNCKVTKVEGRGLSYTVSVEPIADGLVSVGVAGGAFKDQAGNTNKASKVMSFISDRTKPVIKVEGALFGTTKSRHFEMKVSAKDTPETTNVVWYSWSVTGNGQSFGEDFVEIGTNDTDVATLRGTGLNDGVWNWTVEFKDIAGNIATTNGSWAVKSDVAPKLALDPTTGMVEGSPAEPLVFTLTVPENDIELTKKFDTNMVVHVSGGLVFYRRAIKIEGDSLATITLTPVKQDRDFTDVVTLTIPCGAAIGTNGIAAATVSGTVTYKFSGTNKNPEAVRVVRAAGGYLDDPHRTNANLGEITLIAKTLNGAKFKSGFTKASITGAPVKSVTVASDRLSATITLTADARKQLVDIDGWKGFKLSFAGGSVESLPSPISAGSPVTALVKVWRNLARVAGADGAAVKVDGKDAPLAHDGDARTAQVEGSTKLSATFPRARVNAAYIRLSAASAKDAYKPTQATVTLKRAGKTVETIVADLVWDGKRCAPVDLLVTPQDTLIAEAIADEATLSFTGSTQALYLDEFAVFGVPEAQDPLYPEVLSVNPVQGGFVVQTDMGVSNWVGTASDRALKLESAGVTTGVAIDWANISWADATRTALKVPISGSADAGYVGGATLHVYEGFLGNFIGRSNICETISTTNLMWNSQTVPEAVSFTRYGASDVSFGADAVQWTLVFNQPVLNLSGESFDKHSALGTIQVLGTASPTNYIVRAQLNCWTNEVTGVQMTLKAGAVKGLTGKSNVAAKESEAYKLEAVVPVQ